jgi:hypothetical protein
MEAGAAIAELPQLAKPNQAPPPNGLQPSKRRANAHHTEVFLETVMREINEEEKEAALDDNRGLRRWTADWRKDAISTPWRFTIVAATISFVPVPFLSSYLIWILDALSWHDRALCFLVAVGFCCPLGVLFWLFLVDTSAFSTSQRRQKVVDRFIEQYGCNAEVALTQVEDGYEVVQGLSRPLSYMLGGVCVSFLLNVLASDRIQQRLSDLKGGNLQLADPLLLVAAVLLIGAVVHAWKYGFSLYWLKLLRCDLRNRFSRTHGA